MSTENVKGSFFGVSVNVRSIVTIQHLPSSLLLPFKNSTIFVAPQLAELQLSKTSFVLGLGCLRRTDSYQASSS